MDFPVTPKNNPSTDPVEVKRRESLNVSDVIPRALVDPTASNVVDKVTSRKLFESLFF